MRAASVTTILGLVLISGALLAATTTPAGQIESETEFDRIDRNQDNGISRQEAEVNAGLATHFSKFDRNSDGILSRNEFRMHEEPNALGS